MEFSREERRGDAWRHIIFAEGCTKIKYQSHFLVQKYISDIESRSPNSKTLKGAFEWLFEKKVAGAYLSTVQIFQYVSQIKKGDIEIWIYPIV